MAQQQKTSSDKATSKTASKRSLSEGTALRKYPRHNAAQDRSTALSRDPIHQRECEACKKERAPKALVSCGPQDPRWTDDRFISAPAIFPNNNTKYHVNKLRARSFAVQHQAVVSHAVARDKPSAETLKKRVSNASGKFAWLQRHDRESGDLYGMLPLFIGAPYALTDHLERNPESSSSEGRYAIYTASSWTHERPAAWNTASDH